MEVRVAEAATQQDVAEVRALFGEYAASLNFSLCFQSFDDELSGLPGAYAPPHGRLLLAQSGATSAGCVALKPLEAGVCEMKRLYVRPAFRGRRLGERLVHRLIDDSRSIGYHTMRLDTVVGQMDRAIALYRAMGFREIPPYYGNPIENALYFELTL